VDVGLRIPTVGKLPATSLKPRNLKIICEDLMNPLVFVVILNWNNAPDTVECLRSLAHSTYQPMQIVVVDNGSTDDSVAVLREQYPSALVLETGENLGFGAGNNAGIRYALDHGADYVLVLNNDTRVEPSAIAELVCFAEADTRRAIVGPLVLCSAPNSVVFSAGGAISWPEGRAFHRCMFVPAATCPHREPEAVAFVAGCALLARRHFLESAGLLDARYYLNLEDVEWCHRAIRSGMQVWFVPKARIYHKISATLGQDSPANLYYMTRNTLHFFWENAPNSLRPLVTMRILGRNLRTILAWTVKRCYRSEEYRRRRLAVLLGLRDFWMHRHGPMGVDVRRLCDPRLSVRTR